MRISGFGSRVANADVAIDAAWSKGFDARGFAGPVPVLSPREAHALLGGLRTAQPSEFAKGFGASSTEFHSIATRPAILDRVGAILGDDVMLWGASLVARDPGQVHPWHTDMETAGDVGRTVSVWLGLRHVNLQSSLQVVPGSHAWGVTVQDLVQQRGVQRDRVGDDVVVEWARERDETAEVVAVDMRDGDAVFFDGRLWHGTNNTNRKGRRVALLLQYATPDRPMRMPDYSHLEVPFEFFDAPRPPCVMVRGTDRFGVNRIVDPPQDVGGRHSWIKAYDVPLDENPETGWQMYPAHAGSTPCVRKMSCHISVLSPGHEPHPPHRHAEEELLIVLDGEATLALGDGGADAAKVVARAGDVAYYPAWFAHTLRNASERSLTYLMFKWIGDEARKEAPAAAHAPASDRLAGTVVAATGERSEVEAGAGWMLDVGFDGRTEYLRKLHMHTSELQPGAGYEPHADPYDVALVVFEGAVETLGRTVGPGAVVYCAAGDPHGIRNVGDSVARYLVFEFHGESKAIQRSSSRTWRLARRVAKVLPGGVKRVARRGLRMFRARA